VRVQRGSRVSPSHRTLRGGACRPWNKQICSVVRILKFSKRKRTLTREKEIGGIKVSCRPEISDIQAQHSDPTQEHVKPIGLGPCWAVDVRPPHHSRTTRERVGARPGRPEPHGQRPKTRSKTKPGDLKRGFEPGSVEERWQLA